jgi:hypothetical protein
VLTKLVAIGAMAVLLGAIAWGALLPFDARSTTTGVVLRCDSAIRSAFQAAGGEITEQDPFAPPSKRPNGCQQPAQDRLFTAGVVAVLALGVWLGARRLHAFRPDGATI